MGSSSAIIALVVVVLLIVSLVLPFLLFTAPKKTRRQKSQKKSKLSENGKEKEESHILQGIVSISQYGMRQESSSTTDDSVDEEKEKEIKEDAKIESFYIKQNPSSRIVAADKKMNENDDGSDKSKPLETKISIDNGPKESVATVSEPVDDRKTVSTIEIMPEEKASYSVINDASGPKETVVEYDMPEGFSDEDKKLKQSEILAESSPDETIPLDNEVENNKESEIQVQPDETGVEAVNEETVQLDDEQKTEPKIEEEADAKKEFEEENTNENACYTTDKFRQSKTIHHPDSTSEEQPKKTSIFERFFV